MGDVFVLTAEQAGLSGLGPSFQTDEQRANVEAKAAEAFAQRGNFPAAIARFNEALRLNPVDSRIHWAKAITDGAAGDMSAAWFHLKESIRLDPDFPYAHSSLAEWCMMQGLVDSALDHSDRAMRLAPENIGVMTARALSLEAAGELEQAWKLLEQMLRRREISPSVARLYQRMAPAKGHTESALSVVRQILTKGQLSPIDESGLRLSAASLLENLGRYDEAFHFALTGNVRRGVRYDIDRLEKDIDRLISYFTAERIKTFSPANCRNEKPVFIVGMPRSGTSLAEQILASHPEVFGAGELDLLQHVVEGAEKMLRSNNTDCLTQLSSEQADGLAQTYTEPLSALCPKARRIIDKMPLNFLHLGMISLLMPNAKIIHTQRDPLDTCVSCFMTFFGAGNDFKYDLYHLGRFYRQYTRLMNHWKSVLDLQILDVSYEALTADPENESRRMIEFLGLDWNEQCLNFHQTKRAVATASVQQVRRPMYRSSQGRWRRYDKHLTGLKSALGLLTPHA